MSNLYINLLNFNNAKLAGVGYFFKRIVSNIDFDSLQWKKYKKIVVLANSQVDILALFEFRNSLKIEVLILPMSKNFAVRILYEQVFLPFFLIGRRATFFSPTPAVPLIAAFFNKRLIVISTIHDMIPFKIKDKYSFLRSVYVKFISKQAALYSSKIITVSNFSKKDIVEIARVDPIKVQVVYNFIPELKYEQLTSSQPYFVTVCTVEPGKNIEVMLKGFRLFLDETPMNLKYKYKIIGQFGWNYLSVFKTVEHLNLLKYVEFTGYLNDDEKNNYLRNCAGMIYLSKYEGFGIPPLEAMYFNKVSIVSDRSSLPEVVGVAGIVQDPDDSVLLALNLQKLIEESDVYQNRIEEQLNKFRPDEQIDCFTKCLTQ